MSLRTLRLPAMVLAALLVTAGVAWALGFELGESKAELELDYAVEVTDHGTGRVTIVLTIADAGRLAPLTAVDLNIPNDETEDGSGYVDLSVALAASDVDGKQEYSVHILRDLAERASLRLRTGYLDGKQEPLTWYYHSIPIADYLDD